MDLRQQNNYYNSIYGTLDKQTNKNRYDLLSLQFEEKFGENAKFFFSSPGRCELVGNHTDHNCGKVLVSSITLDIAAAVSPKDDNTVLIYSGDDKISVNLDKIDVDKEFFGTTYSLICGVACGIKQNNGTIGGFNCTSNSTLPLASGLSSSAAFEMLVAQIFNHLYNDDKFDAPTLARISQYAENVYFGKPCGLLDQFGVALGGINKIDFSNLDSIEYFQCPLPKLDKNILLVKTIDDHAGLTEQYASIPTDMKMVAKQFGQSVLGAIDVEQFENAQKTLPDTLPYNRARHFFAENLRVEQAYSALLNGNNAAFYDAIEKSGLSSRHLLKNCALPNEQNSPICYILDTLKSLDEDCAVRVHGGGFRGGVLCFTRLNCSVPQLHCLFREENVYTFEFRQTGACAVSYEKLFDTIDAI